MLYFPFLGFSCTAGKLLTVSPDTAEVLVAAKLREPGLVPVRLALIAV
jgi:hypothetical protein